MFRVNKVEYVNKTFRLKKELVRELEQYASQSNVSLNELVSQCCRYALDARDKEPDPPGFQP